jgi:hypothetical protein
MGVNLSEKLLKQIQSYIKTLKHIVSINEVFEILKIDFSLILTDVIKAFLNRFILLRKGHPNLLNRLQLPIKSTSFFIASSHNSQELLF